MLNNEHDSRVIEKVQRPDFKELEKLFASAFGEELDIAQIKRRINRARQFYYLLHPLSKFSLWVKNHFNVYVVKIAGKVVGFIQVSFLNKTQLHVDYIAFSKEYRGQGLGTWMLNQLLEKIADTNSYDVVLEVRVGSPAYRFYTRLGFGRVSEILHYERRLETYNMTEEPNIQGFRSITARDRAHLYQLYLESVPQTLRKVVKKAYGEFNPGMVVRHLETFKNYLMRKRKKDFVVEDSNTLIAWLSINSYVRTNSHILNLILHPKYEYLRPGLISKAVAMLKAQYGQGNISTTIYNDNDLKLNALEAQGFKKELAYSLMFRPALAKRREMKKVTANLHRVMPAAAKPLED